MATWYVRPDTSHSGTRNGTSYANAWGGWSEIVWGASGVKGGDDLYVCGVHTYAAGISVGAHGGSVTTPCTIRGDYAPSVGSIVFSPTLTNTLTNGRTGTNIMFFQSLAAVTHNGAAWGSRYIGNIFDTPGGTSAIRFSASGDTHSDIEIRGNTFNTTAGGSTNHAALRWWVQSAANSSMLRCTIEGNTFTNAANRSVIEFRTQTDSNSAAYMADIKINYNTFNNYRGCAIELTCPGTTGQAYQAQGCQIKGNKFLNGLESPTDIFGGCIGVWGFALSYSYTTFGDNIISDNYASNIQGPTGFVDSFYGRYIIQDNVGDTFYTSTIDANGILLDIGTKNTIVRRNKISNIVGKAGVFNSGCGVMILGKCTNNYIYGNQFVTMKTGFFLGDTAGACDNKVFNNVFIGITDAAIQTTSTASLLNNVICMNNMFSGTGYKVKNATTGPVAWTKEQFNVYSGLSLNSQNHTLGSRSKQYTSTVHDAVYKSAALSGLDAELVSLIVGLPTTLLQIT
jgi:hypothetical protein